MHRHNCLIKTVFYLHFQNVSQQWQVSSTQCIPHKDYITPRWTHRLLKALTTVSGSTLGTQCETRRAASRLVKNNGVISECAHVLLCVKSVWSALGELRCRRHYKPNVNVNLDLNVETPADNLHCSWIQRITLYSNLFCIPEQVVCIFLQLYI